MHPFGENLSLRLRRPGALALGLLLLRLAR
jgi:hypothetical protein